MADHQTSRPAEPRLLSRVHAVARARHLSLRTEEVYRSWIVRFVRFHDLRRPAQLGADDVRRFLEWLATERAVAASTLNQAHAAILFLYRDVLREPDRCPSSIPYARPSKREAVVLSPDEASRLLATVPARRRLVVSLLYGAGLRLMEALTLRVKDVDVGRRRVHVRDGKGGRDRFTMLPDALREAMVAQIEAVRRQHLRDVQRGGGYVVLPHAFDRKSPSAARLAMDVGVPHVAGVCGCPDRPAAATSRVRLDDSASDHRGGSAGGVDEAGDPTHAAAFVCHASAAMRV